MLRQDTTSEVFFLNYQEEPKEYPAAFACEYDVVSG